MTETFCIRSEVNNSSSSQCPVCFGLLHEKGKEIIENVIKRLRDEFGQRWEEDDEISSRPSFYLQLILPTSCIITEKYVSLVDESISYFNLKDSFRAILSAWMEKEGIRHDPKSPYKVNLSLSHLDSMKILSSWTTIRKVRGQKKYIYPSRKRVEEAIESMSKDEIVGLMDVGSYENSIDIEHIKFYRESVYLAGRYVKLSRKLSQTPWLIGKKRLLENSVSDCLEEGLGPYFEAKEIKFMSAGREDADVRCLGTGRPFLLEFKDPAKLGFKNDIGNWEERFNQSFSGLVQVRNLAIVDGASAMQALKSGEEHKSKDYRCVVWTELASIPDSLVESINGGLRDELETVQRTPVRVIQRRALADRPKTVHAIRIQKVSDHFYIVHLRAQAGTYIKEFIHGDMERCKPNFGDLVGCKCDILELDVLQVHLEWPIITS